MNREEFEILCREDVKDTIKRNLERDPLAVAMDRKIPYSREVSVQISMLQRCREKLPEYYNAGCIIDHLPYEQSSSSKCASNKNLSGESLLDLTCGLGVDVARFSSSFSRITTIEIEEMNCLVARENFKRLGLRNIEVINSSAEDFVASCSECYDWCFADPDRRSAEGKKLVRLEDCTPNIIELMPRLRQIAKNICIKCSPLFDIGEAFRLFDDCRVEVVSLQGECKEVNIYIDGHPGTVQATAIDKFSVTVPYMENIERGCVNNLQSYKYVILPDVSLVHSRICEAVYGTDSYVEHGVVFSTEKVENTYGREYKIGAIYSFPSRELKKAIRGKSVEIYKKNFSISLKDICKILSIKEGNSQKWLFTEVNGEKIAVYLDN